MLWWLEKPVEADKFLKHDGPEQNYCSSLNQLPNDKSNKCSNRSNEVIERIINLECLPQTDPRVMRV